MSLPAFVLTGLANYTHPLQTMSLLKFCAAIKVNGGASYNLATGELNPESGYFVSRKGHELKVPYDHDQVNALVQTYVKSKINELLDHNTFLGAWRNDKFLYLDLSVIVDSETDAYRLSEENEQLAYFNNATKETVHLTKAQ